MFRRGGSGPRRRVADPRREARESIGKESIGSGEFDEDLWVAVRDLVFPEECLSRAPEEARSIVALLALAPAARIVDIPCGTGRHAIALARLGFQVTAVDRCAPFIGEAMAAADKAELSIQFRIWDMREFVAPAAFDAALNLYSSFGYFASEVEDRRFLENIRSSLKPQGHLVLDLLPLEGIAGRGRSWSREVATGNGRLREINRFDEATGRLVKTVHVPAAGGDRVLAWSRRLYARGELTALLAQAGFCVVACYADLTGTPLTEHADRLVIVAANPG